MCSCLECIQLEKPTSLALAASLLANLPSLWGIEVMRGWFIAT